MSSGVYNPARVPGSMPEYVARLNGDTSVSRTSGMGCICHIRTTCMFVCPAPIRTRSFDGSVVMAGLRGWFEIRE